MDNTRLFDLGWKPKIGFDEGLKSTVKWFMENKA